MIFKIADGREYFYQWDLDRQLIVSDSTIKEVHFCNRTDVCSLVVEVVDGVANVPNKLLQSGFNVRVFGYDGKATMHEATFEVKARTQPTDYVYTETEIKRYSDLEKRIDEMEALTGEAIEDAVNSYLEENPITMDGYASKEYVDNADATLQLLLTQHNHDGYYASKNHTHSGYATETYVDNAVKNVDVDLTDYAKKTDIPDTSKFITSIPSEYVTESELEAKKYVTASNLNGYAKTNHTHSTADVDGLQKALNEKATQADIDKAIELHDHRYDYAPIEHSHGDEYAAKTHVHSYNSLLDKPTIPSVEGLASEAYVNAAVKNVKPDLTGYATEQYVDDAVANIEIPEVNLDGYATKADLDGKANKTHYHSQYLVGGDLDSYAKKSELFSKDYNDLTNKPTIPSIDGLATEEYVDAAINNIPEDPTVIVTSSSTKEDIDNILNAGKLPIYKEEPHPSLPALGTKYIPFYRATANKYEFMCLFSGAHYITATLNLSTGVWTPATTMNLQATTDLSGLLSYAEEQTLLPEQKNTAKANMGLPYVVSEQYNICTNKEVGIATGPQTVSMSIGLDGAATLSSLPVGTKFTVTIADAATNPTFTETVECELTSSSSFKRLTDVTNSKFFDSWSSSGSIGSYDINMLKKDTSGLGLPYYMYLTVIAGEFEAANKLDSRLVDLSGYITREEFASIKTAEGGAY